MEAITASDAEAATATTRRLIGASVEIARLDAADIDSDVIIKWFQSLPVDQNTEIVIVWPSDRRGARLRYSDFATHYDDLWYPSADDVWVIDSGGGWVLELDHEEVFTLRRVFA